MNIDQTIAQLLEREGGYVNNPADRGGETMFGITEPVARAFGYQGPISMLPKTTAAAIYRARYWFQPRFDQVALVDQGVAEELLDTGVNMGTGVAARFLQRALNVLNNGAADYPNLTVDGAIGAMTLYALRAFVARRSLEGRAVLLRMLNAQQSVRYMEIAEANASQEQFEYGWQRARVS